MEEIVGSILSVKSGDYRAKTKEFVIKTDKRKVNAQYTGFLLLDPGNDIFAKGNYNDDGVFVVKNKPYIVIHMDDESITDYIVTKIGKYGMGYKSSEKLVKEMRIHATKMNMSLPSFLTSMSLEFHKSKVTPNYDLTISNKLLGILLDNWFKLEERRLFLLGLTRTEIRKSMMEMDDLYDQLITNPFVVHNIPLEKCKEILNMQGKKIVKNVTPKQAEAGYLDTKDYYCGEILRYVYDSYLNKRTSISKQLIINDYYDYETVRDRLISTYKLVEYEGFVTMKWFYDIQVKLNEIIDKKIRAPPTELTIKTVKPRGKAEEDETEIFLDDEQNAAVKGALTNNISLITGGAGTGKTTVIKSIVRNAKKYGYNSLLCSYTGKAASRIEEVVLEQAFTIHRIISTSKSPEFTYLIIDEVSMVTIELFYLLLKKYITNIDKIKIILVGDINQLPPIDPGFLLNIISDFITVYTLEKNYRFINADQHLKDFIDSILNGKGGFKEGGNFEMYDGTEALLKSVIKRLFKDGIKMEEFVVVSPFKEDKDLHLTYMIQNIYNRNGKEIKDTDRKIWRIDDKVIMTKNCYDINVFNGEEGKIIEIDKAKGEILVNFGTRKGTHGFLYNYMASKDDDTDEISPGGAGEPVISLNELTTKVLAHSYLLTVHKSQGSEWKLVVFYCDRDSYFVNNRITYTASTRAKIRLIAVCNRYTLNNAIKRRKDHSFDLLGILLGKNKYEERSDDPEEVVKDGSESDNENKIEDKE